MAKRTTPTRPPSSPVLAYTPSRIPQKPLLVVYCEGEKTEPAYLDAFARKHLFPNELLKVYPAAGVPSTIVRKAIERKNELIKELPNELRRAKEEHHKRFQIWCVFDRDEHHGIPQALSEARNHALKVAFSNPCIELWAVLHFEDCQHRPDDRTVLQNKAKQYMRKYDHEKNPVFDFSALLPLHDTAEKRADEGLKRRAEDGDAHGNPSTSFHLLLRVMRQAAQRPTNPPVAPPESTPACS